MPGTPATTPYLGLPRYDNATDPADFAAQINAITDLLDTLLRKKGEIVDADIAASAAIEESKLALSTDAAPAVGSRRTLGFGADQAFPGDAAPHLHATTHEPGGDDEITGLTDAQVASANKDGAAGTLSMRTLGAGAVQAAAGNDSRIVNAVQAAAPALGKPVIGRPGRIYRSLAWTVQAATSSPFDCDVLDRDDDGLFESASVTSFTTPTITQTYTGYQFRAPATGWYQFEAFAETGNVPDGERMLLSLFSASAVGTLTAELVRLNDLSAGNTTDLGAGGSAKLYLAAGARVAAAVYVTIGPAGMSPGSATMWMTAQRVG